MNEFKRGRFIGSGSPFLLLKNRSLPGGGGVGCSQFGGKDAILLFTDEQWAVDYAKRSGTDDYFPAKIKTPKDFVDLLCKLEKSGKVWVAVNPTNISDEITRLIPISEFIAGTIDAYSSATTDEGTIMDGPSL